MPAAHPYRRLGRAAAAAAVIGLGAACWSDVNEAQTGDAQVGDSAAAVPVQPGAGSAGQDAGAPGPRSTPVDTSTARDSLGVPTSSGTAGGGATTPPTTPPPSN